MIRNLFGKRRADKQLDEEVREYVELLAQEKIKQGMQPVDAKREANMELGGVEQVKEQVREVRTGHFLETLWQDLRYGLRMLRKSPGFAAIAIITLALGIGANTAIFSVVNAVLLSPLPYAQPEQLVTISEAAPQGTTGWSFIGFTELRKANHVFSRVCGIAGHALTLTGHGEPADVSTIDVTPEIFPLLETKPLLGRIFSPEDNKQGAAPVVILSEALWRSQFGADPRIIGSSAMLDKRSFTVVGVMPAGFRYPPLSDSIGIWIPLVQDPLFGSFMPRPGGHWLRVVGRLKPDVTFAQAQAEMDALGAQLDKHAPANDSGWTIRLTPLQQMIVGNVRSALLVLLGAVGLVLLIACANIANLLLSRATSRTKEIAVRAALGAGRARLVRQLLTESAALGVMGAIAGIALAYWGVEGMSSLLPADLPLVNTIRVDSSVLAFALLLSVAASLLFGLGPALMTTDCNFQSALKDATRGSGEGGRGRRARNFLAAAEMGLALALVVAAGLFVRSFTTLTSVNPGFDPERIVMAEVSLPQFQYSKPQQWTAFANDLLARVQASPGMQDSAIGAPLPLADGFINLGFDIEGRPQPPRGLPGTADYATVGPNYFHVMGIPLLRGRLFTLKDSPSAPRVALISETLAQAYFPSQDPLGKRLIFGFPQNGNASREIVGVVGDVRDISLSRPPAPMMYVPFAQAPLWGAVVITKTSLSPATAVATIRHAAASIDSDLPVTNTGLLADSLEVSVAQPRFRTLLLSLFGALALVLASAGIFGVISYSVSCRTRELGIRMALGATPEAIRRMVLQEGFRIAASGLAVGLIAALALTRFLKGQLYGIGATDPYAFVGAAILLLIVALAACYMPARRAMRVDPMVALRYE
ncbi:MAG TPA: ABC transporter permease [Candidatus Acidoferrales bacterium]|nr:ABC transporter permease [Candidatus Acidoferrales bacterium]